MWYWRGRRHHRRRCRCRCYCYKLHTTTTTTTNGLTEWLTRLLARFFAHRLDGCFSLSACLPVRLVEFLPKYGLNIYVHMQHIAYYSLMSIVCVLCCIIHTLISIIYIVLSLFLARCWCSIAHPALHGITQSTHNTPHIVQHVRKLNVFVKKCSHSNVRLFICANRYKQTDY